MTVTHKASINNWLATLEKGGTHHFLLSPDELPHSAVSQLLWHRVAQILAPSTVLGDTVWSQIAREVHEKGGTCSYQKTPTGDIKVTAIIPVRGR